MYALQANELCVQSLERTSLVHFFFFFFFDINEDKHFEICMFTLKVFCTENDDLRNLRTSKRGILVGIPKTCSISYLLGHSRLLLRLLIYQH